MQTHRYSQPSWDTACAGQPASASALEHRALSAHLGECAARRAKLQRLWSGADGFWQMLATHAVSTVLAVATVVGLVWLLR
jgi:hypothetical protein